MRFPPSRLLDRSVLTFPARASGVRRRWYQLVATVAVMLLCLSTSASGQSAWGPWQAIPDGHANATDISIRVGTDGYGNGYDHTVHFRFRNRYTEAVRTRIAILLATKLQPGGTQVDNEEQTLQPGEVQQDGGAFSVGNHVSGFQMLRIQFGYPKARAIFEGGRQICCAPTPLPSATARPRRNGTGTDGSGVRGDAGTARGVGALAQIAAKDAEAHSAEQERAHQAQRAAAESARQAAVARANEQQRAAEQERASQAQVAARERERQAGLARAQAEAARTPDRIQETNARAQREVSSVSDAVGGAVLSVMEASKAGSEEARQLAEADARRAEANAGRARTADALRAEAASLSDEARIDEREAERYDRDAERADENAAMFRKNPMGGVSAGMMDRQAKGSRDQAAARREHAQELRAQAARLEQQAATAPPSALPIQQQAAAAPPSAVSTNSGTTSAPAFRPSLHSLKFFESDGNTRMTDGDKLYTNAFDGSVSRFINVELRLDFPALATGHQMAWACTLSNTSTGSVKRTGSTEYLDAGDTNAWEIAALGSASRGSWETGVYRVDCSVDGTRIGSQSFSVTAH